MKIFLRSIVGVCRVYVCICIPYCLVLQNLGLTNWLSSFEFRVWELFLVFFLDLGNFCLCLRNYIYGLGRPYQPCVSFSLLKQSIGSSIFMHLLTLFLSVGCSCIYA
ncbi:hypothetical protein I3842_09G226500 [Carya illinoinensis]|uniref:Uncharacterized protein n=1 Tax=Carya illinoinensis TaxID=32201 RepID=A0A922J853_CARIL|nr:hypothetical protein I3842_09G226500 [Carya illinoinensis]